MSFQNHRFLLAPVDVKDFFPFSNTGQRLIDHLEPFEGVCRRVKLTHTTVNQDQVGEYFVFLSQSSVTPFHYFPDTGKVVVLEHGSDDELPVIRFLHPAPLPNYHRSHNVGPLDVGYVEGFDTIGRLRKIEHLGQSRQHLAGLRLQNSETAFKGVTSVLRHQLQKSALGASLRRYDLNLPTALLAEDFLQNFTILKFHGYVDHIRQVLLVKVDLLE